MAENTNDRMKGEYPKKDYKRNNNSYMNKDKDKDRGPKDYQDGGKTGPMDKRRMYLKRKVCRFCSDKAIKLDYKDFDILRKFTTEGGKIIPRRMSGNCAKHQRFLCSEIKKARFVALLPYVKN